jgi:hypothetical protein
MTTSSDLDLGDLLDFQTPPELDEFSLNSQQMELLELGSRSYGEFIIYCRS